MNYSFFLYNNGYQGNWKEIARLMGNRDPMQVEREWRKLVRHNFNLDEVLENSPIIPTDGEFFLFNNGVDTKSSKYTI